MSVAPCETPHEGISSLNEDPALKLHVLLPKLQGLLQFWLNKAQADFAMVVHSSPYSPMLEIFLVDGLFQPEDARTTQFLDVPISISG